MMDDSNNTLSRLQIVGDTVSADGTALHVSFAFSVWIIKLAIQPAIFSVSVSVGRTGWLPLIHWCQVADCATKPTMGYWITAWSERLTSDPCTAMPGNLQDIPLRANIQWYWNEFYGPFQSPCHPPLPPKMQPNVQLGVWILIVISGHS